MQPKDNSDAGLAPEPYAEKVGLPPSVQSKLDKYVFGYAYPGVCKAVAEAIVAAKAEAWDDALAHVWQLSDPAYTVVETKSETEVLTAFDVHQAQAENPYRASSLTSATEDGDA